MQDEGLQEAHQLAQAFSAGMRPEPVATSVKLGFNEICLGEAPLVLSQFSIGDGTYVKKHGGYAMGRSPAGVVLGGLYSVGRFTANRVGNEIRRRRAAAEAEGQWHSVGRGTLILTNHRLGLKLKKEFSEISYAEIDFIEHTERGIEIGGEGLTSIALEVPKTWYWFVMLNMLWRKQVVTPPPVET